MIDNQSFENCLTQLNEFRVKKSALTAVRCQIVPLSTSNSQNHKSDL